MVHACHKLARVNEFCMQNLGLGKVKQETTANEKTNFFDKWLSAGGEDGHLPG